MDHGGQFGMEGSVMPQGVDLCDNLAVPTGNLNEFAQTQSHFISENEKEREQGSTPEAYFNNNGNYKEDELEKGLFRGQQEEDLDEVMREEEEDMEESEESSCLICCQSPDTPMTDFSFSETGSLLETPYPFSPRTSPEPASSVTLIAGLENKCCSSVLDLSYGNNEIDSSNTTNTANATTFSSKQYTSTTEDVLNHKLTPKSGPSSIAAGTSTLHSFVSVKVTEVLSHCSQSITADAESTSFSGLETTNWEHSYPLTSGTTEITSNHEPFHLVGFLEQLAKRGDDTHLPQYLHQIAEAFVFHEDYQRAIWCIQLERLYHQRLLDNLSALQKQWETRCKKTSPDLETLHLATLKHICQTHSRPKASDAVCAPLDHLIVPPCTSDCQVKREMEQKSEDSTSSHLLSSSIDLADKTDSSEVTETNREDPDSKPEGRDSFHHALSKEKEETDGKGEETGGGLACSMSANGNGVHPSVTEDMDQPKTAEQQGGVLGPAQEKEANGEEGRDVEEATEAVEMEDEEEAEEERHKRRGFTFCPEALPVETIVSASEVEVRHQEARTEEYETKLCQEEMQGSDKTCLSSETPISQDADMERHGLCLNEEEEEEEEYEVEQIDLIRASVSLDDMAKLITVEEISPAPGLVSILKKRSVCDDSLTVSASPETPAKRRVRFRVPDDGFEQDVGGGDSCLLLFLLCLVTVVISVGGTALYCAMVDTHSSVCQDFSRNADFYIGQIQRGIIHIQHWFTPGS